ncbi:hypothetical protein [Amycolatopsis regifaucium]|uniref:Uncharacterized protein n=1 Tax=Amycolatopsis regifaucium TaxID=546365 RepID=A0A154MKI2_9PSEU|nr:hypothetical protein [Amycolatopsis regifaucium]KZB84523.1 hypothetical protein AVL48_32560 [Amycolatopsis regifaucium]OKA10986.1 hypothetical protein ATP06_0202225 [Amycolatopsis regifaucium]SFI24404.1 hypothetical protein SAMN04489731_109190 [Amycolatopsis regifaucium]
METKKWAAGTLMAAGALAAGALAACAVPHQGTATPAVAVAAPPNTIVLQPPAVAAPPQTVYVAPPTTRTIHPAPAVPVAPTVIAYYDALNRRDFLTAWNLGGRRLAKGGTYDSYVRGFATTSWAALTVTSVSGNTVYVDLSARQTDGSLRTFSGSYTVSGGAISGASMKRLS